MMFPFQENANFSQAKVSGAVLSIISNTSLVILKLAAGFLTGSVAIISEAVHSGMDLLASFMAFIAVKVADKPPDQGHPFGHGKAENLAAFFETLLIVAAGVMIVHKSILGLINPEPLPALGWGALVMLFSSVVNYAVSHHLFTVGKRTGSAALVADAWHLRTDVYTSVGVGLGLGSIIVGHHFFPDVNLQYLDPVCALVVAFMILKAGVSLAWEASTNLLDQSLSQDEIALIKDHIKELAPGIKGFSGLKTRRSGPFRFVVVNLEVDGNLSVRAAHALGDQVVQGIREHYPEAEITFHLEPEPIPNQPQINKF